MWSTARKPAKSCNLDDYMLSWRESMHLRGAAACTVLGFACQPLKSLSRQALDIVAVEASLGDCMAAYTDCAWRFGGLRSQTSCPLMGMRPDPLRPSQRLRTSSHGRQAARAPHSIHHAAAQLSRPAPHAAKPEAAAATHALVGSEQSEAHTSAGHLLLKSLTWPQLERWCAANGATPMHTYATIAASPQGTCILK